jgi:ATP synthase protein I
MTTIPQREPDTNPDKGVSSDANLEASQALGASLVSQEAQDAEEGFEPMTHEQAVAWRAAQSVLSPWALLAWQCVTVVALGAVAWWLVGPVQATSFVYGGAAIVVPAALMVVGLHGRMMRQLSAHPAGSLIGFAVLEVVKLLLSVVLMVSAPRAIEDLSWLALLAGVVVALKVHVLVFVIHSRRAKRVV